MEEEGKRLKFTTYLTDKQFEEFQKMLQNHFHETLEYEVKELWSKEEEEERKVYDTLKKGRDLYKQPPDPGIRAYFNKTEMGDDLKRILKVMSTNDDALYRQLKDLNKSLLFKNI